MLAGFDTGSATDFFQVYLTGHIGGIYFGLFDTSILLLALAAAALTALNLWQIGKREDRERRLLQALHGDRFSYEEEQQPSTPPWYQLLGTKIASTRIIGTAKQESLLAVLSAAGVKGHGHLAALIAAKVCAGTAFVPLGWLIIEGWGLLVGEPTLKLLVLGSAFIAGWRGPEMLLSRLAKRRRIRLEAGMPDALDLLVICAEAGLSLDHAIEQAGNVLQSSNAEVAKEFAATAAEMRVSPARTKALEHLAERASLASLRSIVVTLNQSIQFGTPLAESLRTLAAAMRAERLARFEERAARLPVLLTIPLMAFVLPSLIVVISTPLVLRIFSMFGTTR